MRLFGREVEGLPRLIVIFVAILLASSGLCGLQLAFQDHVPQAVGGLYIAAGVVELGAMLISAGGIVVFSAIWVIRSIYEQFAGPPEEQSIRLFKDEDVSPDDRGEN